MTVLVTGAAGYIGSIVSEKLIEEGYSVVGLDNLSQGHRAALDVGVTFIQADLGDEAALEKVFTEHQIDAVMHFAAYAWVGESMTDPAAYFRNNVACGINLLNAMVRHGVKKLVFSSSCAVYGEPGKIPIDETCAKKPTSPYGESKLIFERMLFWYRQAYGLSSISLRYFNAAGASLLHGEDHDPETHLIPNVLKAAAGEADGLRVFGADYPTVDGTCVRDYIHVLDIARAHVMALRRLDESPQCKAYNLGNGAGYSILQVIEAARRVCGVKIPYTFAQRRPGDPATLIADHNPITAELGWKPQYPALETIIRDAWQWKLIYPMGYVG
jgi:UDP-glucose 4-epimerase